MGSHIFRYFTHDHKEQMSTSSSLIPVSRSTLRSTPVPISLHAGTDLDGVSIGERIFLRRAREVSVTDQSGSNHRRRTEPRGPNHRRRTCQGLSSRRFVKTRRSRDRTSSRPGTDTGRLGSWVIFLRGNPPVPTSTDNVSS